MQKHRPDWQPSAYSALYSAYFESHCFTQRLDIGLEIVNNAKTKRWLTKEAYPTVVTVVHSQTTRETADSANVNNQSCTVVPSSALDVRKL